MRDDVVLTIKNTLEETEGLTLLSLYTESDTVFGVYVNNVRDSLSFLALPKFHIETKVDNINIQLFELGTLLHHVYFHGALKFLDILHSSYNIIEAPSIFVELSDLVYQNIPFNIGKLKLIESICEIDNYQHDNVHDILMLRFLRDRIINFYDELQVHTDDEFEDLSNMIDKLKETEDFIPLCYELHKCEEILNDISFSKISEKKMNDINNMYVDIQIKYMDK